MVERIDGDVRELNNFFAEFALTLVGNLLLIAGVVIVTVAVDWRIGLAFIPFTVLGLWLFSRVRGAASPYWQRARAASANLYGEVEERLGGLPDIRANGAEGYVQQRFTIALRELFHASRSARIVSAFVGQGAELVMAIGAAAILAIAAGLYLAGMASIGVVVSMSMYAGMITTPLQQIMLQIDDLQRATASIARIQELLATAPTIQSGLGVPASRETAPRPRPISSYPTVPPRYTEPTRSSAWPRGASNPRAPWPNSNAHPL
jgi:ABC-type multidrug transport system fused ATPase/permease subunit